MQAHKPNNPSDIAPEELLAGIDLGIEAHLSWTHRLMRTALLHESPGDDMLHPNAHHLCQLGRWLDVAHPALARFDTVTTEAMLATHQEMHDAVRAMCLALLLQQAATAQMLADYESNQQQMVAHLHTLRMQVSQAVHRIDVLTGLPLRHGLQQGFNALALQAAKSGAELWLTMIDIDRFKAVNDVYGHPVGDLALKHVAQVLSAGPSSFRVEFD